MIETDKATIDWECTEDGYLAAILIPGGTNDLPVGTDAAIIVPSATSVPFFANYKPAASSPAFPSSAPAAASTPDAAPAPVLSGKSYPPHQEVGMPALSPTMEKGNIVQWKKAVGARVQPGDLLCIIETDKATIDFEAVEEGFLAAVLVKDGTRDVPVGSLIAVIAESEKDVSSFADFSADAISHPAATPSPVAAAAAAASPAPVAAPTSSSSPAAGGSKFSSPRARALAAEKNYSIASIVGTGPNGRVIEADVLSFVPQPVSAAVQQQVVASSPAQQQVTAAVISGSEYTDYPHSNVRKVIAQRLTQSKQTIPHYYLTMDINVDQLLKVRAELNESAKGAYKLSVNDFVVKAAAIALRQMPEVNSQWTDTAIRRFHTLDINVAVATENGLLTPLIRCADNIGLTSISSRVKELADAAKSKKINPNDLVPGTFTISNLGMFGISSFCAVINPPQACILAVGGTEKRVVVDGDDDTKFKVVNTMTVTLSCDHRVVDGAVGATWLQKFKALIERPNNMLLW
ncbi:MAG: pyruvate dehydrogenase complex dihydrolipoamide acetyltransferase [archaeon]|nr:pyruvate dehydrogenase complex dihydrolipoamide acetyltransferase [archaeon]